jgi:hypothetical protein
MQERGLLGEFNTPDQLNHEIWKSIEYDIAGLDLDAAPSPGTEPTAVGFLVQPHQEREVSGVSSKRAPRYTTKYWLDVTNSGSRDAEGVTFEAIMDDGLMQLVGPSKPTTIHRGQTRRLPVIYAAGGSDGAILRIRWIEDGEERQHDFHVG